MINWIRQEKADNLKYPDSEYIIEILYFDEDKKHFIMVKQLLYGSYIYYYVDNYPRIKRYLEGKYMDEAKEIIVALVKALASCRINFYENILNCLENKE